jgi:hypothetical protein
MSLKSILLTALVIFGVWYWLKARELKDLVYRRAVKYCESMDLSVLDQAVVLKSIRFKRDSQGVMRLVRRYSFDFTSDGEQRYPGEVLVLGNRIEEIKLAPHRV